MSAATARRVVTDRFPRRSIRSVTPLAAGNRKWTAVVRFDSGDPLVVQQADETATFRVSARLLRTVGTRTPVPVPAVHAVGARDGTALAAGLTTVTPTPIRRLTRPVTVDSSHEGAERACRY